MTTLTNCHPHTDSLGLPNAGSLAFGLESMSSQELWSAGSVGFPIMIFTSLLAHTIPPPSLHLESESSTQSLTVDL